MDSFENYLAFRVITFNNYCRDVTKDAAEQVRALSGKTEWAERLINGQDHRNRSRSDSLREYRDTLRKNYTEVITEDMKRAIILSLNKDIYKKLRQLHLEISQVLDSVYFSL